ncbi:MAG: LemA family protein, LemA protein [Microgenomates group bacterium GW2011_GWC1_43_13]|uniref:LemA family protein n=2 Tax=Candidatus Woeseibacteriota TaxID=1752722 RepID=A0A837I835_9BACT|nr:MAG: LemA family protein, LemA protein [Microgenomates group bacterium GW2011_GWC1_43_13]KKT32776.1 MAG: LemA family protein [Candidatus Woesebacteria bacterium GW2011_GWB1_44_11]KKT53732.1 MAG: LemA family protein [Candidatus Woesebacteria bacterium GW2011_GWA1_44_23]
MNLIYVLLIIGVVLVFWVISTYNFFVSSKTRVGAAIQEIGNQLKRQAELIPNLESSAKGYLTHEKEIFNELTAARKAISSAVSSGNVNKMADAGKMLSDVLPKIQVVVESNPEIKGAEVVKDLMDQLRDTSDKVMYARRLMIDLTADYNVKLVTVPSSLVAGLFHFEKLKGFETPEDGAEMKVTGEEMKTPKVKL